MDKIIKQLNKPLKNIAFPFWIGGTGLSIDENVDKTASEISVSVKLLEATQSMALAKFSTVFEQFGSLWRQITV